MVATGPRLLDVFSTFLILVNYANSQFYNPCPGRSKLGGRCDIHADCDNKGSICLRGTCLCHPHYFTATDEKGGTRVCKPLPAKIGAPCDQQAKCREPLFCRNGECHCVQRGATHISGGECIRTSRIGEDCSRHFDCTSPFSACVNSKCVCISGTIQQGSRCVAAANCPLGGLPGQGCTRKVDPSLAFNLPSDQDDCPIGQVCVTAGDSPIGHCCPVTCPLASHVDTSFSCEPGAARRCPSDTHFCHLLSDGGFSQAVCCRRPCNSMSPLALYSGDRCVPRGQLNSACSSDAQCGGGEGMRCAKGQCICVEGFHPAVDLLTDPKKNPSQYCTRDCDIENLSKETSCMKPTELGRQCFVQKQCPKNAACWRGRCMCKCDYRQEGKVCVKIPPPPTTTPRPQPQISIPPIPGANDLLQILQGIGEALKG